MRLQLVERRIVGQELGEVLGAAESIEVGENRVALDLAGVLDPQVVGVGVHAHDLLLQFVGRIGKIDAVAQRFGHLGLAVGARQTHARRVVGQQDLGLDERRPVYRIELVDDLARLLDHGFLVLAGGHRGGAESRDVGSLADGIGEETHGNALPLGRIALDGAFGEPAHLNLGLDRRIALEPLHGDQIHVIERQFAQLRNLRLHEKRGALGIEPRGEVVQSHFDDVLPHLLGIVGVVGEGLGIGDHDEDLLEFAGVLQLDAAAQRPHVMAQVETTRRTVAGKDYFAHRFILFSTLIFSAGEANPDRPPRLKAAVRANPHATGAPERETTASARN